MKNRNHDFSSLDYQPQVLPTFVSREPLYFGAVFRLVSSLEHLQVKGHPLLRTFFFFKIMQPVWNAGGWGETLKREGQVVVFAF